MENKLNVHIKNVYDGPMDLLLDLIKRDKIDIYDIPIAYLTDEFINTMGKITYENIESYLEFAVMAATLLHIKSSMLLPNESKSEDDEDPRINLVSRLLEYNYFKTVSNVFFEYYLIGSRRLTKKQEDLSIFLKDEKIEYNRVNAEKISGIFQKLMYKNSYSKDDIKFEISEDSISVEESIENLLYKIKKLPYFNFNSIFDKESTKMEIITYFLAILELSKDGKISIIQNNTADIFIKEKYE